MPHKNKDKEKIETDKVVTDKVSLSLSAEKPIKSWFDIVSQDQSKVDSSKALEIQQWVESISRTPELLKAIQATIKPPASELPSILGLPPSDGGITSDLSLTFFLQKFVMVLNSSNPITNLQTLRKSFLPFAFIAQNSLFHGSSNGTLTIRSIMAL